jgi:uncharacterized protein (DUF302 family)
MLGTSIDLRGDDFDAAIARVTEALAAEGFGVISRIDLDKAFCDKLGVTFPRHTILGACNPGLAHKAVSAEPAVALLLPCNVTVEEIDRGARVRIVDAAAMMSGAGLDEIAAIRELAEDANTRLSRVSKVLQK